MVLEEHSVSGNDNLPSFSPLIPTDVLSLNRMPMFPLENMYPIPYLRVKSYSSTIQFYASSPPLAITAVRLTLM